MSESTNGITDEVVAELTPAEEALHDLVAASVVEPEAEVDGLPQRIVVPTEHAWTVQSQHGVLLDHFVPTQDYTEPGVQGEFSEDNW